MNSPKAIPVFEGERQTPLEAIRAYCVWCCGGSAYEVSLCPSGPESKHPCAFWVYRRGIIPPGANRGLMGIIKAKCADCMPDGPAACDAFQTYEIHPACPCWPYRMGRNPNIGTEQREKLRMQGKRQMNFTGSHPVSASQTAPKD